MFPNHSWNADRARRATPGNEVDSEYQTSDTSIGNPPGLTGERFISFARNTVNRGILQKHYSRGKDENL